MPKIIVTDKMSANGVDYLKSRGFEVDTPYGISHEELLKIIGQYDGIIVRSATKVRQDVIDAGVNLKVAGRAGNGVDNIDVPACTRRGITVVNTPEGNIMAAAEMSVALIFSVFRNVAQAHHAAKCNDFRRNRFVGEELEGKTAGVIGLGKIGAIVARKLKGVGMHVVGYDPYITEERAAALGVERIATIDELMGRADLITLHIPKSPENKNLIGARELALCKKGVRIVNVARGGMIDEMALYEAVKSGQVAGAAVDVQEVEPNFNKAPEEQDYKNPLLELEQVTFTPHLGASTKEANLNCSLDVSKLVEAVLNGELVPAVNMPSMGGDVKGLAPYIELGEKLGSIYYQAEQDTVQRIEVVYSGELAEKAMKPVTLAVVKGFLCATGSADVNYVNAELKLAEFGVELVESRSSQLDKFTNLITVRFVRKDRTTEVSGTVFGKDSLRIVDFFGYRMDFEPSPFVLALQNHDVPGIIGKVGSVLGEKGINIAAMQWSRKKSGDKAVSFVSVDSEVDDATLQELKSISGVLKASRLRF